MNRQETLKILAVIKAMYPVYYKNSSQDELNMTVNGWEIMLKDYTYEQVSNGLKAYITTDIKGFPPSVGQLIDKIHFIYDNKSQLSELEAWSLVSKAIRNSTYNSEKEYQNLPAEIQKAIGSPSTLRSWAILEGDDVETVIQSNFMRSYRNVSTREREIKKIPSSVSAIISNICESKSVNNLLKGVE